MIHSMLAYGVGPLLYCPANNATIVDSLISNKFGSHFSLALCLEDTIADNCVEEAENILIRSLKCLDAKREQKEFYLPWIFIRIRNEKQIPSLIRRLGRARSLVKGFILPKFSLQNADTYIKTILQVNEENNTSFYILPIFESPTIIPLNTRYEILYTLKDKLDAVSDLVLNVRVGGNDLCHMFGFRRHNNESIHEIRPIANIFSDIVTVFGMDYVVSGPVWEYYNGTGWEKGLINELQDDRLCGFIGKTAIHPKQLSYIRQAYQVSLKDYEDAKAVLGWDDTRSSLVSGSITGERMNEYKTHTNWARKILALAEAYGVAASDIANVATGNKKTTAAIPLSNYSYTFQGAKRNIAKL